MTAKPQYPIPNTVLLSVLLASLGIVVGLIWDISWHRSIGRDTFWSPPHVLEQLSALVAGVSCGWVVLRTTFSKLVADRERSVRFWGFHGPLGAWVCIWGTLMMIVSAPFDNWWHNAYGLDVRIISPPHMVLSWGMLAIQIGAMLTALAWQNRAGEAESRRLGLLYIASAAILLTMHATVLIEEAAFANQMHAARFYQITAIFFPLALVALAVPARTRWPATTAATMYMALEVLLIWGLQLVPAEARLAPIFNPVTHLVPQPFPLLLVVPAFGIDLLLRRSSGNAWKRALMVGVTYVASLALVQWFFADFLLSPAARNFFFGADHWDYNVVPGPWRHDYWQLDADSSGKWSPMLFAAGLGVAAIVATLSARAGLWLGTGMSRIRR
jgi:hypothetical protein